MLYSALASALLVEAVEQQTIRLPFESFKLRPSQVHNDLLPPVELPQEVRDKFACRDIAITNVKVDVEVKRNGKWVPAPTTLLYNHHIATSLGDEVAMDAIWNHVKGHPDALITMQNVPLPEIQLNSTDPKCVAAKEMKAPQTPARRRLVAPWGIGDEYARTNYSAPKGFGLHVFNMSAITECPCNKDRVFNISNNSIDQKELAAPLICSTQLLSERNPSCALPTYQGGLRCCDNGVYLDPNANKTADQLEFRPILTLSYIDPMEEEARDYHVQVIDTSHNQEYDIPQCPEGTKAEDCTHSIEDLFQFSATNSTPIQLVSARTHFHIGGLYGEIYNALTGELLCRSNALYGNGSLTEVGNERDMLVGITSCAWENGTAPVINLNTPLRMKTVYNASSPHRGVMADYFVGVTYLMQSPDNLNKTTGWGKVHWAPTGTQGKPTIVSRIKAIVDMVKKHKGFLQKTQV